MFIVFLFLKSNDNDCPEAYYHCDRLKVHQGLFKKDTRNHWDPKRVRIEDDDDQGDGRHGSGQVEQIKGALTRDKANQKRPLLLPWKVIERIRAIDRVDDGRDEQGDQEATEDEIHNSGTFSRDCFERNSLESEWNGKNIDGKDCKASIVFALWLFLLNDLFFRSLLLFLKQRLQDLCLFLLQSNVLRHLN